MQDVMVRLFIVMLIAGISASARAQETLSVDVLEQYETLQLTRDSVGCFDVLAALRLQSELAGGAITDETRQAFSSGACIVASPGLSLVNAQKVSINAASLIRGEIPGAGVTVYIPAELKDVSVGETAAAPLATIAADLKRRVGEMQRCSGERDALDTRIDAFNARVEAVLAQEAEEKVTTGSRLKGNKAAAVSTVALADPEVEALRQESLALQSEATAHKDRCGEYEAGITLDQDYMPYYRATTEGAA